MHAWARKKEEEEKKDYNKFKKNATPHWGRTVLINNIRFAGKYVQLGVYIVGENGSLFVASLGLSTPKLSAAEQKQKHKPPWCRLESPFKPFQRGHLPKQKNLTGSAFASKPTKHGERKVPPLCPTSRVREAVFRKVVLAMRCRISVAFSMLALSSREAWDSSVRMGVVRSKMETEKGSG